MFNFKIHLAAESSINLLGMGQYVALGSKQILWMFINKPGSKHIPSWFNEHFVDVHNIKFKSTNLFRGEWDLGLEAISMGNFSISVSSLERAIMECLYLAPRIISIEHAAELMEKLRSLRPELCQELLLSCSSVKVKRLFLYMAELNDHSWFKYIDKTKIDLGNGTRQITKNGKYIAKYRLVLPHLNKHEGYGIPE
jgi:hypothetical protein